MDFPASNHEMDEELKQRAREYILQQVCEKYRLKGNSEFDPEEMEKALRAFDKNFLGSKIRDVLNGWELIEFTEEGFTLRLNGSGIEHCQQNKRT